VYFHKPSSKSAAKHFACSFCLFFISSLKFYQTSHLKIEIASVLRKQILFPLCKCKKGENFNQLNVQSRQSSVFFIKHKKENFRVSFNALLNRKIKKKEF
jgi:hypothetical protein